MMNDIWMQDPDNKLYGEVADIAKVAGCTIKRYTTSLDTLLGFLCDVSKTGTEIPGLVLMHYTKNNEDKILQCLRAIESYKKQIHDIKVYIRADAAEFGTLTAREFETLSAAATFHEIVGWRS